MPLPPGDAFHIVGKALDVLGLRVEVLCLLAADQHMLGHLECLKWPQITIPIAVYVEG